MSGGHVSQTLILKTEVEQPLSACALSESISQDLPQKGCFAGTAHANDRYSFALYSRQPYIPAGKRRHRSRQRVYNLPSNDLAQLSFHVG
jgi:hypothetical protein